MATSSASIAATRHDVRLAMRGRPPVRVLPVVLLPRRQCPGCRLPLPDHQRRRVRPTRAGGRATGRLPATTAKSGFASTPRIRRREPRHRAQQQRGPGVLRLLSQPTRWSATPTWWPLRRPASAAGSETLGLDARRSAAGLPAFRRAGCRGASRCGWWRASIPARAWRSGGWKAMVNRLVDHS